jgi:hypothetical protein
MAGRRHVDPLIEGNAEFARELVEKLARIAFGLGHDFRSKQPEDDAVLVRGPDRAVAPQERGAGALFPGKTE